MYALKTLLDQRLRFVLTVFGVALCVILMLFLLSIYKGVSDGSVEYVRASDADLWVLQKHATNILRSTSILTPVHGNIINNTSGVESVSPILFILASVKLPQGDATIYLTGYDPESGRGGPPVLAKGSPLTNNDQIILDQSFASKYRIRIGDRIPVKDDTLTVVGFSTGTNMFVIQYAFITLEKAHSIVGFNTIVSGFQVKVDPEQDPLEVAARIESQLSDIAVFDSKTFLENNIREMESGLMPLLFVVAVIGAIVLTAILSLILSVNVLERRNDFAIMKALGSPNTFIPGLVIKQALILATSGIVIAIILFFPLLQGVEILSPEVSARSSIIQIIVVAAGVIVISLISSVIPNRRLRKIYPMEVFK